MDKIFPRIAIVGRRRTPEVQVSVMQLAEFLSDQGLEIYLDAEAVTNNQAGNYPRIPREEMGSKVDLAIVIGGDGTLLGIARLLAGHNVPLIGVNHGRLGFMTDVPLHRMMNIFRDMLEGQYVSEERILLETSVQRDGQTIATGTAFNDVVFSRGALGAMIEFEIFIDGQFVYSQRSDGLIVTTPTGSTAYALAAGGPILHPSVPAIALVPICPQSMTNRPIAVSDKCQVEVVMLKGFESRVHFDGQSHIDLKETDRIFIKRSERKLTLLHPTNYNYYDILREKLHWGEQLL
ncbi:NAD kinase [Leeia sp. TBRC 13508]|uniref:NAD kinase n=1 Tax=Leeia speluncae TaxID=2884804 RepID=A0ABS8D8G4_9NEIS|nr:NAD kinase [Leeia speluncae]MCB6184514.1 NAD kinase [Leeia speluncae]